MEALERDPGAQWNKPMLSVGLWRRRGSHFLVTVSAFSGGYRDLFVSFLVPNAAKFLLLL